MSSSITNPQYEGDCFTSCCCSIFCCLGCCHNLKKATRIKVTWTWLVLMGVASSVILSCYLYKPDYPYTSPSDMRPVTNNVNFLFCEAVSIDSVGISMDAYTVLGPLAIDPEARVTVGYETALYSDIYDFNFFTLYLLPGTTLRLRHCAKDLMVFYVFNGLSEFEEWKSDQYCESCYVKKIYLIDQPDCSSDNYYEEYNLNVTTTGEMFFVYANQDFHSTWVNLKININRTIYDLSHANPVCTDEVGCDVSLDGPGITIVYHVDDTYDIGEANHPKFTTKCVPRVWAYFMIHGLAILLVGITSSMLIQKLCKDTRDPFTAYRYRGYDATERSPLLYDHSALPPSYSSVALSPPKYEDIIRDCESPPPYPVAVAALNEEQQNQGSVSFDGLESIREQSESIGSSVVDTPNDDTNTRTNAGAVNIIASNEERRSQSRVNEEIYDEINENGESFGVINVVPSNNTEPNRNGVSDDHSIDPLLTVNSSHEHSLNGDRLT